MTPGSILFDREFEFHDGGRGEKILVILSNGEHGFYVIAKTTSNGNNRGVSVGCQLTDKFPSFFLPADSCCLSKNTWVCLHEYYEFNQAGLLHKSFQGLITHIGTLDAVLTNQLQRCALASEDISLSQENSISNSIVNV